MNRILFSLQQAFKQRVGLKKIKTVNTICDVDAAALKAQGISTLVLDYDGVLTAHNGLGLSADIDSWLRKALEVFGDKVFVLSNQPKPERMDYFKEKFPSVTFVVAKKKPYPDGMQEIVRQANVLANEVVLVDDRLLTGGLACVLAQCQCLLVTKPYQDFKNHFLYEIAFASLRIVERLFFFKF